jgi:hypothetical protein
MIVMLPYLVNISLKMNLINLKNYVFFIQPQYSTHTVYTRSSTIDFFSWEPYIVKYNLVLIYPTFFFLLI